MSTSRAFGKETAAAPPPQVASWYTQGRSDGLGDRLLMFDNTNAASLELLRFRSSLAATPEFEQAVRERVARLSSFDHPAFPPIRAVEHLDDGGGLALVSTHVPGRRLSEMFQGPQPRAGLHPAFVTWLIRQLTSALASLQSEGEDFFHGALAADRVIVSVDGHLLIAEHVLGSALQGLRLTPWRLDHEFGVLAPATKLGVVSLSARTDVVQLALTALSVLLGRQITLAAYQDDLERLLDEFSTTARQRSPFLALPLRVWLERALQLGNHGFRSAADAEDGLKELPEAASPRGFTSIQPNHAAARSLDSLHLPEPRRAALEEKAVPAVTEAIDRRPSASPTAAPLPYRAEVPISQPVLQPGFETGSKQANLDLDARHAPFAVHAREVAPRIASWLTLAVAAIALIEAAIVGRMLFASAPPPRPEVPVLIESPQYGDVVVVDGRPIGLTPLTVTVGSKARSIRVIPADDSVTKTTVDGGAGQNEPTKDTRPFSSTTAGPRIRSGGVRLVSPIALQVFENERLVGSSATGPIIASSGLHDFDLINSDLGYSTRQRVNITEGQILPLTITPPSGRVTISSVPPSQVWIDGRQAGETPLADIPLAAGNHTIIFRHPEQGERRETLTLRPGAEVRIDVTLRR